MEMYLEGLPGCKKLFYKAASLALYPTIFSAIGFAYISVPSSLQATLRRLLPFEIRELMLSLFTLEGWLILLFSLTVFFAIWGGAGSQLTVRLVNKKHREILSENGQLKEDRSSKSINCYRLFTNYLYSYFQRFELGANERVSLYKLDMDMFSCIGRHSDNEVFNTKPSRLYPRNQGCISKAWELGKFQDAEAPDPDSNLGAWNQYNIENFGFDAKELERIRMKSRSFYCIRLKNSQNATVAVLVFESLNPNGLPFGRIDRLFKNHETSNITNLIESLENHIPNLESAKAEGF